MTTIVFLRSSPVARRKYSQAAMTNVIPQRINDAGIPKDQAIDPDSGHVKQQQSKGGKIDTQKVSHCEKDYSLSLGLEDRLQTITNLP